LSEEVVNDIDLNILKSEIPPEILATASSTGIPPEVVAKAREEFNQADWQETLDYLRLAQQDSRIREYLESRGIEIQPQSKSAEEKEGKLTSLSLDKIREQYPEKYEAEKSRRISKKREELAKMLEKFKNYLPLEDLPLPDDADIKPDVKIPSDLLGAYGLWRLLLTSSYVKRINDRDMYKGVRKELHRVGGRIPVIRAIRQRVLALRILQNQKHENPTGNFGAQGLGFKRYKENFRSIEEADTRVRNARRALDRQHKNNFVADGQATPRNRLAESIIDIRLREIAFRKGKLNPEIPRTGDFPGEDVPEVEEMV
jgi:hypothetical protein